MPAKLIINYHLSIINSAKQHPFTVSSETLHSTLKKAPP